MPFVYDPRLGGAGYRDTETGRTISYAAVREQVDVMITASEDVQVTLAEMVTQGTVSPSDWEAAMRQEIKDNYITQYLAGIGGIDQMTQADWGSIGGMIADQYSYLNGFAVEVATGDLAEGQILRAYRRARMYINSSREAYNRASERNAERRGLTEHAWALGQAEHCDDCVALADEGFKEIDKPFIAPSTGKEAIPGSGDTICLTNCACHLEYR